MSVPFVYNTGMANYDFGKHPFRAANVSDLREYLQTHIDSKVIDEVSAEPATDDMLLSVHSPDYIEKVLRLEVNSGHLSMDTWVAPGTPDAAKAVVGGAVAAIDLALDGNEVVLCTGGFHHAGVDYGEGFCIYNDVAIAARHAGDSGAAKVMIIDTDAHQGNGTMDIFYRSCEVLFLSLHQHPRTLYPGRGFAHETGDGDGKGYTVNIPMFPFSRDPDYKVAFARVVAPVVEQFDPDLIIRNGGADPHFRDQLTALGMSMDGLRWMGGAIRKMANGVDAPLVDLPISGYGDHAVPGWLQIWSGATGTDLTIPYDEGQYEEHPRFPADLVKAENASILDEVVENLKGCWELA